MLLKSQTLSHFRSFSSSVFYFSPFLTVVVGPNSVGKTNLLESVYFILSGLGIKDDQGSDLISFDKNCCRVRAEFAIEQEKTHAYIQLQQKEGVVIKQFTINKVRSTASKFTSTTPPGVLFTPQRIESLTSEPARRRRLFDTIILTYSLEYKQALSNYSNGIYRRNRILESGRRIDQLRKELSFWDTYLVSHAATIQQARQDICAFLNKNNKLGNMHFSIEYKKSNITEELLRSTLSEQLRKGRTFIGPQRDDYEIYLKESDGKKVNILTFGSRSQQRLALLWVLLNELSLYNERLERRPLLLLDDIFSELDDMHIDLVVQAVRKYQTILTTVDPHVVEHIDVSKSTIVLK